MPHLADRSPAGRFLVLAAALCVLTAGAAAQGGKGGKKDGPKPAAEEPKEAAVKANVGATPKEVEEAITKNADKMKKECQTLSEKIGSEIHGAQGTVVALRAEESADRVLHLTKLAETMVYELSRDFGVDPVKDLWAAKLGPFHMFCFKSKSSFGDAYREFLEKRFGTYGLANETERKQILEIGRFIREEPGPLAGGEIDAHEYSIAHWISQQYVHYLTRLGMPPIARKVASGDGEAPATKPATVGVTKEEMEILKNEDRAWIQEGFAMYGSVRFLGANRTYCVTNSRYLGKTGIADKDLDTSYRLVCLEMAQGEEDKMKDFATLVKTENNSLNYLDLAKAWSFFDWMMREDNRPKLLALLTGMRSGAFQTSLKKNLGLSLAELEAQWKDFVLKDYGGKKKTTPTPDPKDKKPNPKDPKKK
jgi:hypothetical protein